MATDASLPALLPAWVRQRDGRTEPFDPARITRTLFAATRRLGRPDPFAARELTDGVLHFLAAEAEGSLVPAELIAETVVKVVRELGQPHLAQALGAPEPAAAAPPPDPALDAVRQGVAAGEPPLRLLGRCGAAALERFSLQHVYSPDLAQAHQEGLLRLGELAAPRELAAAVVRLPARAAELAAAVQGLRGLITAVAVVDAVEEEWALGGLAPAEVPPWVAELNRLAAVVGWRVVLNVHVPPPPWATIISGPLFPAAPTADPRPLLRQALREYLQTGPGTPHLHWWWHEASEGPTAREFGPAVTVVADRPKRPLQLAEGVERPEPALLLRVGLNLPALLTREPRLAAEQWPAKVLSLARLAVSAGVQKRDFLRRHGDRDRPAFLLDRARLGLALLGLGEVSQHLFGPGRAGEAAAFGRHLEQTVQQTLDREARHAHLHCVFIADLGG